MPAEIVKLKILYSDLSLVVIEKPGGLLSVPGRGMDKRDCVASRIRALFPGCIEQPSVHRLDQFTSGLMVMALTRNAHRHLSLQFASKSVKKIYIAMLDGIVKKMEGEIVLSFRLDPNNRPYQIYDPDYGKSGITRWKKIRSTMGKTRVEFLPLTGRTHQLRLHAAHELGLGCPIVGDRLYGKGQEGQQMLLHASYLCFCHPESGLWMEFNSTPPF
jgi:tRNA pseudouridine32 synthase / 23S rRNA pseudouridine746 synthase